MFSKTLTSLAFGYHIFIYLWKTLTIDHGNYVLWSDFSLDCEPHSKGFPSSIPLIQGYFIACLDLNAASIRVMIKKPRSSKTVFKNISQSVFSDLVRTTAMKTLRVSKTYYCRQGLNERCSDNIRRLITCSSIKSCNFDWFTEWYFSLIIVLKVWGWKSTT